jgi:hypothetical protein
MIAFSATVRVWVLVLNPLSTIFQLLKVALNTRSIKFANYNVIT